MISEEHERIILEESQKGIKQLLLSNPLLSVFPSDLLSVVFRAGVMTGHQIANKVIKKDFETYMEEK